MPKNSAMPYSYHTFLYPFYWESDQKTSAGRHKNQMLDCVEKNSRWSEAYLQDEIKTSSAHFGEDILNYNTYQYFMPKARGLIFDNRLRKNSRDSSFIRCFQIRGICPEKSCLKLKLGIEKEQYVWYRLPVLQIRLEIMEDLQIGIVILETENLGECSDEENGDYRDILIHASQKKRLMEITRVNDLGRRIFSPYLSLQKDGRIEKAGEAPARIRLLIVREGETEEIYDLVNCESLHQKAATGKLRLSQVPEGFSRLILGEDGSFFDPSEQYETLKPAVDDRMFTICCMGADSLPGLQEAADGRYAYQHAEKQFLPYAEQLYQLIFLEREGNLSCQNPDMLVKKLGTHMYTRWIRYGTVYGITEYSFICVTGCDTSGRLSDKLCGSVINPFLSEYMEMAKISLLQRAAIIRLENDASLLSRKMYQNPACTESLTASSDAGSAAAQESIEIAIGEIQDLWKKYVLFQSELFLPEVTFQEQGAEIYDILKDSFRMAELSGYINSDMHNLHELAGLEDAGIRRKKDEEDNRSDNELNRAVNLFSVIGISISLAALLQDAVSYAGISSFAEKADQMGAGNIWLLVMEAALVTMEFLTLYEVNRHLLADLNQPGLRNERYEKKRDRSKKEKDKYGRANKRIWIFTILIVLAFNLVQLLIRIFGP